MKINADFSQRVLVHSDHLEWLPSPTPGVMRRPLDRIGAEVARATTIVRFDAGSAFAVHTHAGGEEYLVLEGVFQDETGDFPEGSYVRNPPGSRHKPASNPGCTIFVKLWQSDPNDRGHVHIDTATTDRTADPLRPGIEVLVLFARGKEIVRLEHWAPGETWQQQMPDGAELLVLDGTLTESGDVLNRNSWLRIPPTGTLDMTAGPKGARIWIKTGHLSTIFTPHI